MIEQLKSKLNDIYHKILYKRLSQKEQKLLLLLANLNLERVKKKGPVSSLEEVEMQVFSQWGEDGIIQYIVNNIEIPNKIFVEFGVENYTESNTRYLLVKNNWSGLVIDGSKENIEFVKNDPVYAKHDLIAVHSFITKHNINNIIKENIDVEDIGLLSIDIDGNDYWIWKEISIIKPRIIICEYNSVFGPTKSVTVPYKDNFHRMAEHYSNLYFGASLGAFCHLAEEKGYDFIGSNSTGVNAFFVRKDLSSPFKKYTAETGYIQSKHRESRDSKGNLNFIGGNVRLNEIKDMILCDLIEFKDKTIKELYYINENSN